jgi:hypothetical protein
MILKWYQQVQSKELAPVKTGALAVLPITFLTFYLFISSTTANLICFFAFLTSISFIIFSVWLLGQILDNNTGTRAMQEVADPIREGSEGFFMT